VTREKAAAPAHRVNDAGRREIATLGSSQLSDSLPDLEPQAPQHSACQIVLASQCKMTSDLLADAIEIANAYGLGILRAVRERDDGAILENFRCFDLPKAAIGLLQAVADAEVTPEEAGGVMRLIDGAGKAIEVGELAERIAALEGRIK
jgi:hypothetical protein